LKQLKIKKFAKSDPYEVCAICLDDFEEGVKLRILPCEHGLLE
jgi:E3 ubiquitin-protein ligase RNF13